MAFIPTAMCCTSSVPSTPLTGQSAAGKMLAYLQKKGAAITLEDVRRCNQGKTSGRPHFARTLVELGYASSVQDAFEKYLTTPEFYARVERPKPTPEEGIRVIRSAGGVAVLAHPHQLKLENDALDALVAKLKVVGLQGIEAYYSRHTPEQTQFYLHLAEKYDLLYTCGSDFHGPVIKPEIHLGTGIDKNLCVTDGGDHSTFAGCNRRCIPAQLSGMEPGIGFFCFCAVSP